MKKKVRALFKTNSGFSLIEILVAIFIFAFVIGAVMSIFVTSVHVQNASDSVTRAEAAAQKFVENLYGKSYSQVLALQAGKFAYNGYYLTFRLQPQGMDKDASAYVHIVFTDGGYFIVGPDGKYTPVAPSTNSITVLATSSAYSVTSDGGSISGTKPSGSLTVIANGMKRPNTAAITNIYLGSSMSYVYYCTSANKNTVAQSGTTDVTVYEQTAKADKSLVRVQTEVYLKQSDVQNMTVIENMLQLNNG